MTEIPSSGLNIAALSRRTGVAPDTLRKWEQRYGILRPVRTAGGQRRYTDEDVARVEWLRARLAEGYRIGEAAAILGGAEVPVGSSPAQLRDAIVAAAGRSDAPALARLLDQAFALGPVEAALRDIVQPVLERIGEAWLRGELSVAQEHLLSEAVRGRLERLLADARGGVRGVAVLACVPGERHDLGLLMLAVLLRADGWQVAYLGPDTPLADAVRLAEQVGARVLCLSAAMSDRFPDLVRALRDAEVPSQLELMLGGAAVTEERAAKLGARYVNGDLRVAVRSLRKLAA